MDHESFSDVEPRPATGGGFQFSLAALFILMTAAAVVLGGCVALAAALGLNVTGAMLLAVGQQVTNLPRIIIFLVAIVMLGNRRVRSSRAARYGLIGFGGLLLLSLSGMGFQIIVQAVVLSTAGGSSRTTIGAIFAMYGMVSSALGAICYGFLLAAILTRGKEPAASAVRAETTRPVDEP